MIFFTDENFPYRLAGILRLYDDANEVRALLDHFKKGTPDVDWLREVGRWDERPVIISGDGRILSNAVERKALRESGCNYVYLSRGWTEMQWQPMVQRMLRSWPEIVDMARRSTRQSVLELAKTGRLERKPLS